tara:strand:+ start:1290 stop:3704 length:2415 start_codon:yes stop_codon:yes gene_type:complete
MSIYNQKEEGFGFPDPLASAEEKSTQSYGLKYAKAIERQWGKNSETSSLFGRRNKMFQKNRDYSNGVQDTSIYKKLLRSLDPNDGDGSLLNLDYTPVPILPKFVRVVVNKILSRNLYPNLEAVDPLSSSEKNEKKKKIRLQVEAKEQLAALKEQTGVVLDMDPEEIPDTPEEAEIMMDTNIKTDAEISAQIGTEMTLRWNDFDQAVFRRAVNDLVTLGTSVVKRSNDPNYGISTQYVDPINFVHSYTEDPGMNDLVYAGHTKKITIGELKRLAGDSFDEESYEKIALAVRSSNGNKYSAYNKSRFDERSGRYVYEYDQYTVEVLDFEFKAVDCIYFEEKESRHGNSNFFYKGFEYKEPQGSVYERKPHKMEVECIYGGSYIMGTAYMFGYSKSKNMPKNIHDLTRAQLSYSSVCTNLRDMKPKSMVDSCMGFADMLQITHLKIQQAIAKAKPDGLIIDIEGLENVQLGKGGDLQPLDLHDIYEKTGVFYYRSKNPEGGFQGAPIQTINNNIRNINELVGIYNHYLQMIRDTTGINEAMDASSPKGDALVGVREQAISAGNNAIYDITNASMIIYKKVCEDIVKCLQVIPEGSVLYKAYENAIGMSNMEALNSFKSLPMYNFGVLVNKDMEDSDKQYLEQNIQMSLQQQEIDLEDAMAVRSMKDVNQAERLLIVRRKKRMKAAQEAAQANAQQQAQQAQQAAQMAAQSRQQEMQMEAEIESQKIQLKAQVDMQMEQMKHEFEKEIAIIKAQSMLGFKTEDQEFKEKLETFKEEKKDDRISKQAAQQSKLMSQRKGERGELQEPFS